MLRKVVALKTSVSSASALRPYKTISSAVKSAPQASVAMHMKKMFVPSAPRPFTTFLYQSHESNQQQVQQFVTAQVPNQHSTMVNYLDNILNCALFLHNAENQVRFHAAIAMFHSCADLFPVDAKLLTKDAKMNQQVYDQALVQLVAFCDKFAQETSTLVGLLVKAFSQRFARHDSEALETMKQMVAEAQRFGERKFEIYGQNAIASHYLEQEPQKAIDLLEQVLQKYQEEPYTLQTIATIYSNINNAEKALEYSNRTLALEPDNFALYTLRGNIFASMGKNEDALKDFQWASKHQPNSMDAKLPLAVHYAKLDDLANALLEIDNIVSMSRYNFEVMVQQIALFNDAIQSIPNQETVMLFVQAIIARRLMDNSQEQHKAKFKQELETTFETLMKSNDTLPELYYMRALLLYTDQGKMEESMADINRALDLRPSFYQAWEHRGTIQLMKHFATKAQPTDDTWAQPIMEDYSKALSIEKDYYLALWNRSTLYTKLNQLDKAMADLDACVKQRPMSFFGYVRKSHLFQMQNQNTEALEAISTAIQVAPEVPQLLQERANLYRKMNRPELAQQDETVVKLMTQQRQQQQQQQ